MKLGQRVEILLLADTAKKAFERIALAHKQKQEALATAQEDS